VSVANAISPNANTTGTRTGDNGGGGGVQFQINTRVPPDVFRAWFTNESRCREQCAQALEVHSDAGWIADLPCFKNRRANR
jgi:hypothetical protein